MLLCPTLFSVSTELTGPKHSTSVPSSVEVASPLSVDEYSVTFVPNPVPGVALKSLFAPQVAGEVDICDRIHRLRLPPTLQMVIPFTLATLHVKVIVPPGQVGGGAVNCPDTSSKKKQHKKTLFTHAHFTWHP